MVEPNANPSTSPVKTEQLDILLDRVETMLRVHLEQCEEIKALRHEVASERARANTAIQQLEELKAALPQPDLFAELAPSNNPAMGAGFNSSYSSQSPPNQDIQAIDRAVIQTLLNEIDSCISLLES